MNNARELMEPWSIFSTCCFAPRDAVTQPMQNRLSAGGGELLTYKSVGFSKIDKSSQLAFTFTFVSLCYLGCFLLKKA